MITPQFLILLGLIVLPLCLGFSFSPVFLDAVDPRNAKDFLSVLISLLATGMFFRCHPKVSRVPLPLLLLLGFCVTRCFLTPLFSFPLLNTSEDSIWQYRALSYCFIFSLLFLVVSNVCWSSRLLKRLFTTVCWVGFLTAVYCIIQWFHLDQWQTLLPREDLRYTPSPQVVGTMTHVTLAAAFLIIPLPFMIQTRRWLQVVTVLIAIYLCHSDVAYGGAIFVLLCYGLLKRGWWRRLTFGAISVGVFILLVSPWNKIRIQDSGRFSIWKQVWSDVIKTPLENNKTYFLTGYGLGSYRYLFTSLHTTTVTNKIKKIAFNKAHNEYVEWFYNTGAIGTALLLFFIFYLITKTIPYTIIDERYLAILCAFIGVCVCAGGTFVWQIEPHRFFTVVLAGLIQNRINQGEKV